MKNLIWIVPALGLMFMVRSCFVSTGYSHTNLEKWCANRGHVFELQSTGSGTVDTCYDPKTMRGYTIPRVVTSNSWCDPKTYNPDLAKCEN